MEIRKSTTAMIEAILLGSLALFSKKLAAGKSNMANKKEKSNGTINSCPMIAIYPAAIIMMSIAASFNQKGNLILCIN